jgi:hypothetical protein
MLFNPHLKNRLPLATLTAALLAATAGAATAETLVVNDLSFTGEGGFSVTVPTVEAVDANIGEADIRAIFAGDFAAADLAGLDAARISIPEVVVTAEVEDPEGVMQRTVITYRELELVDVADGVAASSAIAGADVEGLEGTTFTFGRMSSGLLDIGAILGFYGLGGETPDTAMKPIYRDLVFEGIDFSSPEVTCELGTATIAEFSARPIEGDFAEIMVLAQQLEAAEAAGEPPPPGAVADMVQFYADFLTAFASTPMEMEGLSCSGQDKSGEEFSFSLGPVAMGGFEPGIYPPLEFNNFRLESSGKGWMELENFTWKRADLTAPLAALEEAGDDLDEAWFAANWRRLIPAFDGFAISGFAMDIVTPEKSSERLVASMGVFDATLGSYVNGVPSAISTTIQNLRFDLPPGGETAALVALGIEQLDLGAQMAAAWDEVSESIKVENVVIEAAGLGRIGVSGTLINATADLFSENPDLATLALTRLAVTDLQIEIENDGFLPLLIASAAAEEGQDPAALHAGLVGMGSALPIGLLGATPDSVEVGARVAAFLSGTPQLTLNVVAKDEAGVGLAELLAAESDPTALTSKITVTATTSGEQQVMEFPELPTPAEEPEADADGDAESE